MPIPGSPDSSTYLAFTVLGLRPTAKQQIQFFVAANQRCQGTNAAMGVETTFRHQGTLYSPGVDGFGDPFEVMFAKIC